MHKAPLAKSSAGSLLSSCHSRLFSCGSRTDRLFVLTAHQETFVLDVKKLQESFANAASETPGESH